jgi:hypothetical protein
MAIILNSNVAQAIIDNTTKTVAGPGSGYANPNAPLGQEGANGFSSPNGFITVAVLYGGAAKPGSFPTGGVGSKTPVDIDASLSPLVVFCGALHSAGYNTGWGAEIGATLTDNNLDLTSYIDGSEVGLTVNCDYNTAIATGTATFIWFATLIAQNPSYNTAVSIACQVYATVGTSGSGADIIVPTTSISSGDNVRFSSLKLSIPSLSY